MSGSSRRFLGILGHFSRNDPLKTDETCQQLVDTHIYDLGLTVRNTWMESGVVILENDLSNYANAKQFGECGPPGRLVT